MAPLFEMRTGAIVNRLKKKNEGLSNATAPMADSTDGVVGPLGVASIPGHPEDCADQHATNWTAEAATGTAFALRVDWIDG
jgi:hypothetical protein